MPKKTALILVYNHRYDRNIPVLEKVYGGRFSAIYHLVPFYDGPLRNVIPVYENSYRFQGYIAQGYRHYFKEDFERYLFVADDLLLNPDIDENNLEERFGLEPDSGFLTDVFNVHRLDNRRTLRFEPYRHRRKTQFFWWRLRDLARYKHQVEGLENGGEMPTFAEAEAILQAHNHSIRPLKFTEVYGPPPTLTWDKTFPRKVWSYLKSLRHFRWNYSLAYPAVAAFSDIAIVPKSCIERFAHYCGVFAANGLFVEFALPTALMLSAKKVVTESSIGKRGAIYWTYDKSESDNYAEAMKPYGKDLYRLLQHFPSDRLFIHPIKLSQWKF